MSRPLRVLPGIVFLAALAGSNPAFAQIEPGFELSPYAGVLRASGGVRQVLDARRRREIRSEIEQDGTAIGLRGGYNANRILGLEFAFRWASNRYSAELTDLASTVSSSETTSLILIDGNGVAHLAPGRVVPYVTGGVGVLGTVDRTNLAFNVAAGVKLFVTPRVAARVELRRFFVDLTDVLNQIVLGRGGLAAIPETYTDKVRLNEFTAGMSIVF